LPKHLKFYLDEVNFTIVAAILISSTLNFTFALLGSGFDILRAALFTLPLFLVFLYAGVNIYYDGRAQWWFLFVLLFVFSLAADGLLGFFFFLKIENPYLLIGIIISLLISAMAFWRFGSDCFNAIAMQCVLASKRIDVERGTYSPYIFPVGILKTKNSKYLFTITNAGGPFIISLTLIFGHWLGVYHPKAENLWAAICSYVLVLLCVYAFRAGLGEYGWIRRWEKETGRTMYIAYVVDWKNKTKKGEKGVTPN
jgi:hypothetical protein